jgi:esterase/lipase
MLEKDVEIPVGDQKISARLFTPQDANKQVALLFLHGWTGRPNYNAAARLQSDGYFALTIIMRGHEGSDGDIKQVTAQDSLQDAQAGYDYLKRQIPEGTIIAAVGNSYGSYIAALLSSERKISALSLRVPAAYPDEGYGKPKWGSGHDDPRVDAWRHELTSHKDNKGFLAVNNFKGPVQIIEGENDDIIPRATIQNYVDAVSNKGNLDYKLMKGWPHSIGSNQKIEKEFEEVLLNWLTKIEAEL